MNDRHPNADGMGKDSVELVSPSPAFSEPRSVSILPSTLKSSFIRDPLKAKAPERH